MLYASAACAVSIGKIRGNNEDNLYFNGFILPQENTGHEQIMTCEGTLRIPVCYGVFDGMGGEARGEEASYIAAKMLKEIAEKNGAGMETVLRAIEKANSAICEAADWHREGLMGSTLVTLCVDFKDAHICNLGDSRAYLLRREKLRQISEDHTDWALLEACGIKNRRPRLTQHLGIPPTELMLQPYCASLAIQPGDRFLLCSDGLTDMVQTIELEQIMRVGSDASSIVSILMRAALQNGGRDNITIIVCEITEQD